MSFLINLFKRRVKSVNLTICGLDNAGKTTFVNFMIYGEFRKTTPTMGVKREAISFDKLDIHIFDLGGQEDFRPIWSEINEQTDALIYVVDSADHLRFEETKEVFNEIIEHQITANIPVLILLHKKDLENRIARNDFICNFGLVDLSNEFTWAVFETSAITGEGVAESIAWFIEELGG